MYRWFIKKIFEGLTRERESLQIKICDFPRFRYEVRPGDVILVEGRSRLSEVIKTITLSRWTHSALYIGRIGSIEDEALREKARKFYPHSDSDPLIIEAIIGEGVIISPLTKYKDDNLRLCRPKYLSPIDADNVIEYAIGTLGTKYFTRQILDIARFMFPYSILPRRWRSSLFETGVGSAAKTICSTMLAEAFASVQYPILPELRKDDKGKIVFYKRNSKLIVPRDFDYSPYFDIIKYPFLGDDIDVYKKLPWDKKGVIYNEEVNFAPGTSPNNEEYLNEVLTEEDLELK